MYYWAYAFKSINSFNTTFNTLPTWLAIEMEDCDPYLPAALIIHQEVEQTRFTYA